MEVWTCFRILHFLYLSIVNISIDLGSTNNSRVRIQVCLTAAAFLLRLNRYDSLVVRFFTKIVLRRAFFAHRSDPMRL